MIADKMGHYSARPNYVNTKDLAGLAEANCREIGSKNNNHLLNLVSFSSEASLLTIIELVNYEFYEKKT